MAEEQKRMIEVVDQGTGESMIALFKQLKLLQLAVDDRLEKDITGSDKTLSDTEFTQLQDISTQLAAVRTQMTEVMNKQISDPEELEFLRQEDGDFQRLMREVIAQEEDMLEAFLENLKE